MATSLTISAISVILKAAFTNVLDVDSATAQLADSWSDSLANGTGASQADIIWWDTRSVGAGANDDLDFNGTLTDAFGNTVDLLHVKGLFISSAATVAADTLSLGAEGAAEWVSWVGAAGDKIVVGAGGVFLLTSPITGYVMVGAASDKLRIHNDSGANAVEYTIVVWGTST